MNPSFQHPQRASCAVWDRHLHWTDLLLPVSGREGGTGRELEPGWLVSGGFYEGGGRDRTCQGPVASETSSHAFTRQRSESGIWRRAQRSTGLSQHGLLADNGIFEGVSTWLSVCLSSCLLACLLVH